MHGTRFHFTNCCTYLAPAIWSNPRNTSTPMNTEATFSCVIDSELGSVVDITWNGPDSVLPAPVNAELNGTITTNLTINVTDGSYEGLSYNCSVQYQNCSEMVTSSSATFFITLSPTIIQLPLSGVYNVGDSLTLTCTATANHGTLSITWTGPYPNLQGMNTAVNENDITSGLSINLYDHTFGGLYTCVATTEVGSDRANSTIYVRPVVTPTMTNVQSGDEVILRCEVQSIPVSSIRWEKQNNTGQFVIIQNESERNLTLRSIGQEGFYRCAASTEEFGEQTSSTTSLITGKQEYDVSNSYYTFLFSFSTIELDS